MAFIQLLRARPCALNPTHAAGVADVAGLLCWTGARPVSLMSPTLVVSLVSPTLLSPMLLLGWPWTLLEGGAAAVARPPSSGAAAVARPSYSRAPSFLRVRLPWPAPLTPGRPPSSGRPGKTCPLGATCLSARAGSPVDLGQLVLSPKWLRRLLKWQYTLIYIQTRIYTHMCVKSSSVTSKSVNKGTWLK